MKKFTERVPVSFKVVVCGTMWFDDEVWKTHTLMFVAPDISLTDDYLIDYSNYQVALDELKTAFPEDVEDASFGHWTY